MTASNAVDQYNGMKYVMNVHVRAQGQIEKEVLCILLYYARNILATFPLKSEALRNCRCYIHDISRETQPPLLKLVAAPGFSFALFAGKSRSVVNA